MRQFLDNPQVVLPGLGHLSVAEVVPATLRSATMVFLHTESWLCFLSFLLLLFSFLSFLSFFFFFKKKGSSDLHGDGEVDRRQHLWFLEIYVLKTAEHSRVIPLLRSMKPG